MFDDHSFCAGGTFKFTFSFELTSKIFVAHYRQVQSPDSHDSGIHVEYTRPAKPVKKLSQRFTPTPVRDESPKRKLPPGWERHEGILHFSRPIAVTRFINDKIQTSINSLTWFCSYHLLKHFFENQIL